jgi:hypothetical protein
VDAPVSYVRLGMCRSRGRVVDVVPVWTEVYTYTRGVAIPGPDCDQGLGPALCSALEKGTEEPPPPFLRSEVV